MSNVHLIIEERPAKIGNFLVGRLLPFREKRLVGPFAFIDHMGPAVMEAGENLDIGPHPHIGLSTLTYLFEGSMKHRDSLGTSLIIEPGAVNWMTAGSGIVHSERTPDYLRNERKSVHGLQIWIALPKDKEDIEPSFSHHESKDLPSWEENGVHYKLIAGKAFGHQSPVPVYSELYLIEIKTDKAVDLNLLNQLYGESGLYVLEGNVRIENQDFGPKNLLVATDATQCGFHLTENTTIYIFGGIPFEEERFIYWNFVSSEKEKIEKAKERWKNQEFITIPDETDWVPLPEEKPFK